MRDRSATTLSIADSLTPASADGFKFAQCAKCNPGFPKEFFVSTIRSCDILLSTHPDATNFWERADARAKGTKPDPMVDASACRNLADRSEEALRQRIASEAPH